MRLLALSGSLRRASINSALLRAAARVAPAGVEIVRYDGLAALPPFNPDLEGEREPATVTALRAAVREADGLLIACPEYAHGVPGAFKNLLDWLVSGEEFVHKPLALLNASPRATHAQAALREIVVTMSALVVEEACVALPLMGRGLDDAGIAADPALASSLRGALEAFAAALVVQARNERKDARA